MESPYDHISETVALDSCPSLYLIGRDILHIAGHIVRSIGIAPFRSDARHELVILVGDIIFGGKLRYGVYLVIGFLARRGVGHATIFLISVLDRVEQGGLCLHVARTEVRRSLEHQVLKIVCQPRGFCRIVARTGAHGNVCLQSRFLLVHRKVYFQSVIEGIDATLHGVTLHRFIAVILCRNTRTQRQGHKGQCMFQSHCLFNIVVFVGPEHAFRAPTG